MIEATYPIAPKGVATAYTESELPVRYCAAMTNRFINEAGGAEKRPGMVQLGDTIAGGPQLDALHELILKDGTAILFASGSGVIYRFDDPTWSSVKSGLNVSARLQSVQMGDRLIFVNGVDRNIYTKDGVNFYELKALIQLGTASSATSAHSLTDSEVINWVEGTDVAINDLVYYPTTGAYGLITAVASAALTTTLVSAAAKGLGAGAEPAAGDAYQIIDTVELNIIPIFTTGVPTDTLDNVALAKGGTSTTVVAVSGVDFSTTDARVGDIIYNATRAAISAISVVSANVNVSPSITGQTAGDSLVFLKSAMPIATFAHVHFGRLYLVDAREQTKIRISGINDPQDFTSDAGTLDSVSFNYADSQPKGDSVLALGSFQRYFIMAGKQYLYAFLGTNPIPSSDTANDADFEPAGLFPQGLIASRGLVSIGNDLLFLSSDGLQSVSQSADASALHRLNVSSQIANALRDRAIGTKDKDIFCFHYARRSLIVCKVGGEMFVYNYGQYVGKGLVFDNQGSWSVWDGKLARQLGFYRRTTGDLVTCGDGGKVYEFDQGTFDDDGDVVSTRYQTGWLTLEEPKRSVRTKQGIYIKPIFECGGTMTFDVAAEAPFSGESTDEIEVIASGGSSPIGIAVVGQDVIGASGVVNQKHPLSWHGEVCRLTFTTDTTVGPDIISRYTLYYVMRGRL